MAEATGSPDDVLRNWDLNYRRNRYLTHLDHCQLRRRAEDLFANAVHLNPAVKPLRDPAAKELFTLLEEVAEEMRLRYGREVGGAVFLNSVQPWISCDVNLLNKAINAVREFKTKNRLKPDQILVKYGQAEHINEICPKGSIRVCPASSYDDPSLNAAIEDKELRRYIQPTTELKFEVIDEATGQVNGELPAIGNRLELGSGTDYYACCFSSVLEEGLFVDFDYDACLVIQNPSVFLRTLYEAFRRLHPDWIFVHGPVCYFDPVNPPYFDDPFAVWRYKHFRYSYQREYRLVWLPPRPIEKIEENLFLDLPDIPGDLSVVQLDGV